MASQRAALNGAEGHPATTNGHDSSTAEVVTTALRQRLTRTLQHHQDLAAASDDDDRVDSRCYRRTARLQRIRPDDHTDYRLPQPRPHRTLLRRTHSHVLQINHSNTLPR